MQTINGLPAAHDAMNGVGPDPRPTPASLLGSHGASPMPPDRSGGLGASRLDLPDEAASVFASTVSRTRLPTLAPDPDASAGDVEQVTTMRVLSPKTFGLAAAALLLSAALAAALAWCGRTGAQQTAEAEQRVSSVASRIAAVTSLGKIDAGSSFIAEFAAGRKTLSTYSRQLDNNLPTSGSLRVAVESAIWPEGVTRRQVLRDACSALSEAMESSDRALERIRLGAGDISPAVADAQQKLLAARRAAEGILATPAASADYDTASAVSLILLGLGLVALFWVPVTLHREARRVSEELADFSARVSEERSATDEAIMHMMAEMLPLSHGDLRAYIPVTEHSTGSIADRINQITETTHDTVVEVKLASAQTVNAMERVEELATDIYAQARKATEETSHYRMAAGEALAAVINARHRVNEARDQIQLVAKRVKHLGESSMDLGSIAELISTFNERVKVLALNTQLIASESQDRGGQYQVIARELAQLAQSTSAALVDANASIRGMQSEASQVIATVEDVTAQVVNSAPHWDGAVTQLRRIEASADKMEPLMAHMRDSTEKQDRSTHAACLIIKHLAEHAAKFITHERSAAVAE